jgi:hypothetical protein
MVRRSVVPEQGYVVIWGMYAANLCEEIELSSFCTPREPYSGRIYSLNPRPKPDLAKGKAEEADMMAMSKIADCP